MRDHFAVGILMYRYVVATNSRNYNNWMNIAMFYAGSHGAIFPEFWYINDQYCWKYRTWHLQEHAKVNHTESSGNDSVCQRVPRLEDWISTWLSDIITKWQKGQFNKVHIIPIPRILVRCCWRSRFDNYCCMPFKTFQWYGCGISLLSFITLLSFRELIRYCR